MDPTQDVTERMTHLFGPEAIKLWVAQHLPGAIAGVLTVVIFYVAWRLIDRLLGAVLERAKVDITATTFARTLLRFTVGIVGTLTALDQLGIDTTSILASLGVVGLTLGFAAQDTLSNVISGMFIFWDRPFVIGDLVELDGEYGRIEQITLRSTRLVTPDGRMFAIPNRVVVGGKVASYTNFPNLRLDIDVTVGVAEDLNRVRAVMLGVLEGDDRFMTDPAPEMRVTSLNDYNVAVQLQAWLINERAHMFERAALRERVFAALNEAGVDMPFETIQLQPVQVKRLGGEDAAAR